jgi:hypothetical protein
MNDDADKNLARLQELLLDHGWNEDTRLFRSSLPEFLSCTPEGSSKDESRLRISANENPSESVTDIYGAGHTCLASDCGPGLAFVESADHQWQSPDRKMISVRIGDVLEQGGRIYPVASVITDPTWYLTLPAGSVQVHEI